MTSTIEFKPLNGPHGRLHTAFHACNGDNRARVLMAHGFSPVLSMVEHGKVFVDAARSFGEVGIGAVLFDFGGNGWSDGHFSEMTPNRRIDELSFMLDQVKADYDGPVFLLGQSMGGAIAIHTAATKQDMLTGLITWSTVPSFDPKAKSANWFPLQPEPDSVGTVGAGFFTDRPAESVGDAYVTIAIPKLQVQGNLDRPGFIEDFTAFFDRAPEPKQHIIVPNGNHVLDNRHARAEVISRTREWMLARCP